MYRQARRQIMAQLREHVRAQDDWEYMFYLYQCKNEIDRQIMREDQELVEHLGGKIFILKIMINST